MKFRLLFLLALWCWTSIDAITDEEVRQLPDFQTCSGWCTWRWDCEPLCGLYSTIRLPAPVLDVAPSERCLQECPERGEECLEICMLVEYGLQPPGSSGPPGPPGPPPKPVPPRPLEKKREVVGVPSKRSYGSCMDNCIGDADEKGQDVYKAKVDECYELCRYPDEPESSEEDADAVVVKRAEFPPLIGGRPYPPEFYRCLDQCGKNSTCKLRCDEPHAREQREVVEGGAMRAKRGHSSPPMNCHYYCTGTICENGSCNRETNPTKIESCQNECKIKHPSWRGKREVVEGGTADAGVVRTKRDHFTPQMLCEAKCYGICENGTCYEEKDETKLQNCQSACRGKRGAAIESDEEDAKTQPSKRSEMNGCFDTCGNHCEKCYRNREDFVLNEMARCTSQCPIGGRDQCVQKCWDNQARIERERKEREEAENARAKIALKCFLECKKQNRAETNATKIESCQNECKFKNPYWRSKRVAVEEGAGTGVVKRDEFPPSKRCMKKCDGRMNTLCMRGCLWEDEANRRRATVLGHPGEEYPSEKCEAECDAKWLRPYNCAEDCTERDWRENRGRKSREAVEGGADAGVVERDEFPYSKRCMKRCEGAYDPPTCESICEQNEYVRWALNKWPNAGRKREVVEGGADAGVARRD